MIFSERTYLFAAIGVIMQNLRWRIWPLILFSSFLLMDAGVTGQTTSTYSNETTPGDDIDTTHANTTIFDVITTTHFDMANLSHTTAYATTVSSAVTTTTSTSSAVGVAEVTTSKSATNGNTPTSPITTSSATSTSTVSVIPATSPATSTSSVSVNTAPTSASTVALDVTQAAEMTTVVGGSGETTDIDSTTNTEQNTSSTAEESTVTSQQNTSTTTASTNTQQTVSQLKPISIIERFTRAINVSSFGNTNITSVLQNVVEYVMNQNDSFVKVLEKSVVGELIGNLIETNSSVVLGQYDKQLSTRSEKIYFYAVLQDIERHVQNDNETLLNFFGDRRFEGNNMTLYQPSHEELLVHVCTLYREAGDDHPACPKETAPPYTPPIGWIVGGTIGGFLLLVVIIALVYVFACKPNAGKVGPQNGRESAISLNSSDYSRRPRSFAEAPA